MINKLLKSVGIIKPTYKELLSNYKPEIKLKDCTNPNLWVNYNVRKLNSNRPIV